MKPIMLATLILALLGGSTQALAGGGGYNGGYHGGNGGYHGGYGGYHGGNDGYHGGYWHGGGYGYYHPVGYYPYYPYYGYHHNNNNYNNGIYYALGGLVLGGLLTNTYYQNHVVTQPVYVQQTYQPAAVIAVPQGRHFVKDLNGNCYERTTDGAGNEMRTELPPANCNW
jgi:hypothetical protein